MKLKEAVSQRFEAEIKNIVFDLGGVLLDIDVSRTLAAFERLDIDGFSVDDIISCRKDIFFRLETGALSPEGFMAAIRETWPASRNIPDNDIWQAWNAVLLDFDMSRFDILDRLKTTTAYSY